MDHLELRTKLASRIEQFRLEEYGIDVHLKPISALHRAQLMDVYRQLEKGKEADDAMQNLTTDAQCFVVARGLVDVNGKPIYQEGEEELIAGEFPAKVLDEISNKILSISGMGGTASNIKEMVKNSNPTQKDNSSSD